VLVVVAVALLLLLLLPLLHLPMLRPAAVLCMAPRQR
jgi:hypothetical protein